MILTIAIISGIMFLVRTIKTFAEDKIHSTGEYGAILVLSTWYLNTTVGIVFLCICGFLFFITLLAFWKS